MAAGSATVGVILLMRPKVVNGGAEDLQAAIGASLSASLGVAGVTSPWVFAGAHAPTLLIAPESTAHLGVLADPKRLLDRLRVAIALLYNSRAVDKASYLEDRSPSVVTRILVLEARITFHSQVLQLSFLIVLLCRRSDFLHSGLFQEATSMVFGFHLLVEDVTQQFGCQSEAAGQLLSKVLKSLQ